MFSSEPQSIPPPHPSNGGWNGKLTLHTYNVYITVSVKWRTAMKVFFLYFNWFLSVMLDSLSCYFTYIYPVLEMKFEFSFTGPNKIFEFIFNIVLK